MSLSSLMTHILFVGQSLVGPDLPVMVQSALIAMGDEVRVEAQISDGGTLAKNWANSPQSKDIDARAFLTSTGTDVLVLTEAQPLAQQIDRNDTAGAIAGFARLARATSPETRVFLYETWPSLNSGTPQAADDDPGRATPWRERIAAELPLWQGAAHMAAGPGAGPIDLIPAGQAMARLADEIEAGRVPGMSSITDAFEDDIRPNHKGQYLVAMVHAAAITGKSPEGLPPLLLRIWPSRAAVISPELARAMQRIAWDTVQDLPPFDAPEPTPDSATAFPAPDGAAAPDEPAPPPPDRGMGMATPELVPITNPSLAFGLNGVTDGTAQQPFLDLMKTARGWTGHLPGRYGGMEHDRITADGYLDARGWPIAIPPGVTALATLVLTEMPAEDTSLAGRYLVTWKGRGVLSILGRAETVEQGDGWLVFDFVPGPGVGAVVTIEVIDTADPIRDIVIVREDRAALLASGAVFNPDWLERMRGVRLLRFMDWMDTNNSRLAHPEDRPRVEDYSWGVKGVPMEVMVALANELDADPWFNVPHLADDDLVRQMAEIARDGLEPGRVAWVEFSNEVWNLQFGQAQWAEDQGQARWHRESTWVQYYALRAAEVADIWAETFADPSRLVRVIATQTGWPGLEDMILTAPDVIAEGRPAPHTSFDAYAVTGYFAALLGADHKAAMVRGWLDEGPEAAIRKAVQELRDGSLSGDPADTLAWVTGTIWPHHAAVARRYGLRLAMYEGGTHVVGMGAQVDDPLLTDFFIRLNYSPEMAALYAEAMAAWAALTDEPFNAFVDVASPSKWGSWGALRHLTDDNPRWRALARGCVEC